MVDVKSTGLYLTDPVLKERGVKTDYWKTGHSYIKRRTAELKALAGFEKSGHFFFNPPIGHGYDDGIVAGIRCWKCWTARAAKNSRRCMTGCPRAGARPPWRPNVPTTKNTVVEALVKDYSGLAAKNEKLLGQTIASVVTVNGVRVTLDDGTWGLVRASSNKPSLVVVVESPASEANMRAMFADIDARLSKHPEVGAYDQKI